MSADTALMTVKGAPRSHGSPRPVSVTVFLVVVTLGLYHLVWWYVVNRELRDLGAKYGKPNPLDVRP